jgi:hypothetical protein
MSRVGYKPIVNGDYLFDNINYKSQANEDEIIKNVRLNSSIEPKFRYYKDDTNLNLTPQIIPEYTYKNKQILTSEKPSQTEHDEIGMNTEFLNRYYGYTDYGYYLAQNVSLPQKNTHKITPKENIFELYK